MPATVFIYVQHTNVETAAVHPSIVVMAMTVCPSPLCVTADQFGDFVCQRSSNWSTARDMHRCSKDPVNTEC